MTSTRTDPIVVAGAGHVGLIAAIALTKSGHNVVNLGAMPGGFFVVGEDFPTRLNAVL